MTETEFNKLIAAITMFYPSFDIREGDGLKYGLWLRQFKDVPIAAAIKNLEVYAAENKFPPSVADLRGGAAVKLLPYQQRNEGALAQLDQWERNAVKKSPEELRRMREELFGQ